MISKSSIDAAKKAGGTVKKKKAIKKPATKSVAPATNSVAKDHEPELKRLRAEISELRRLLDESRTQAQRQNDELAGTFSAMVAAISKREPFRIKPIRNMDSKSPDYLLVEHYDFVPVSYRKLDS